MICPLIAIRPEPGLSRTIAGARAMGLEIYGQPLSHISPVEWTLPAGIAFDGLLLGSANAIVHGGPALEKLVMLPAFCVGQATAQAAQAAGFQIAARGTGGLQGVLDPLAGRKMRLLRVAGADHVALVIPPGITVDTVVAYENNLLPIPAQLAEMCRKNCVVMLHSAVLAAHFAQQIDALCIARNRISLAALGPRILEAAGSGWARARAALRPEDTALLAMARNMCQEVQP